mmetsp:Transcript_35022/g.99266  ORF Transcript_35022/g.99266 Transcript_35022/m.99266 type:complete len:653 (+) Transcript_35022:113-2071(+)
MESTDFLTALSRAPNFFANIQPNGLPPQTSSSLFEHDRADDLKNLSPHQQGNAASRNEEHAAGEAAPPGSTPQQGSAGTPRRSSKGCECGASGQPSFGFAEFGLPGARWCAKCPSKPENAINVRAKRCECGSSVATIGPIGAGYTAAKWCSKCPSKPASGVKSVSHRRCECGKGNAIYLPPGGTWKDCRWCKSCCPADAVKYAQANKPCECGRARPSFGLEVDNEKKWCRKCPTKPPEAVDLVNRQRCECGRVRPAFGLPGDKKTEARWCVHCPTRPAASINLFYIPVRGHLLPPRMRPPKPPRVRKGRAKPQQLQASEAKPDGEAEATLLPEEQPQGAEAAAPSAEEAVPSQAEQATPTVGRKHRPAGQTDNVSQTLAAAPSGPPARKRARMASTAQQAPGGSLNQDDQPSKKRGRPRKAQAAEPGSLGTREQESPGASKKRGSHHKAPLAETASQSISAQEAPGASKNQDGLQSKNRGRPRKLPAAETASQSTPSQQAPGTSKQRGRPRKAPAAETASPPSQEAPGTSKKWGRPLKAEEDETALLIPPSAKAGNPRQSHSTLSAASKQGGNPSIGPQGEAVAADKAPAASPPEPAAGPTDDSSEEGRRLLNKQKALEEKRAMLLKLQQELAAEEAELQQYEKRCKTGAPQ